MHVRNELLLADKKVLADDIVTARAARSGDNIPLIVSLPKTIAEIMKIQKGQRLIIYTDGEQIYIRKYEGPKI
jgi:hypothetical protein